MVTEDDNLAWDGTSVEYMLEKRPETLLSRAAVLLEIEQKELDKKS